MHIHHCVEIHNDWQIDLKRGRNGEMMKETRSLGHVGALSHSRHTRNHPFSILWSSLILSTSRQSKEGPPLISQHSLYNWDQYWLSSLNCLSLTMCFRNCYKLKVWFKICGNSQLLWFMLDILGAQSSGEMGGNIIECKGHERYGYEREISLWLLHLHIFKKFST